MIDVAGGWVLDVERGPGWLFVRLNSAPAGWWQAPPLAECVFAVLKQHFVYRVVLDCQEVGRLTSPLVAQLVLLRRKINDQGGVLRLWHLSPACRAMLDECGLDDYFPELDDREGANREASAIAARPRQPR